MDLTPERFKIGPCDWTTHPSVDVGPETPFCERCGRVKFPSIADRPCRVLRELSEAYRAGREDAAKEERAKVAEEIATAIEARKPSVKRFWDTADAARVYALGDAAKIARAATRGNQPRTPVADVTP